MKPEDKFYFAFYKTKKLRLYFNEIKEYSELGDGSLANVIKKLEIKNEIKCVKERSHSFYILTDKKKIQNYFWNFDLNKFNDLNIDVKISLNNLIINEPQFICFIILFGSTLRKQEKKGSDIDLMVVTYGENRYLKDDYEKRIKKELNKIVEKVNAKSIYPISTFYTNLEEFKKSEDRLIIEAKNTGLPITGNYLYYDVVLEEWKKGLVNG